MNFRVPGVPLQSSPSGRADLWRSSGRHEVLCQVGLFVLAYLYFRITANRRPCICTSRACAMMGFSVEFAGCMERREFPVGKLVPLASAREAAILRGLSTQEIAQLNATMAKIAAAVA